MASELGIGPERIYKWRVEFVRYGDVGFQGHGIERLSDEGREVKELEILKTAIIFLQHVFLKNRHVMYWFIDCYRDIILSG